MFLDEIRIRAKKFITRCKEIYRRKFKFFIKVYVGFISWINFDFDYEKESNPKIRNGNKNIKKSNLHI